MENKSTQQQELVRPLQSKGNSFLSTGIIALILGVIVLGVGTGYLLANKNADGPLTAPGAKSSGAITKGAVFGSDDLKTFKDSTQGVLQPGGIEGEGQYHLVRPGGDSQNVYLTSSIVDLSQFKGKKIKVWGETNTAQSAGWLMDVGRVEVVE